ncbi:MAG: amidohydrolase family protein [Prevotellaceae bacterium]|jgi:cytosine/adenosine deaminase-related metal-dependent hydrolase|nr:amidohydrolase family protein [Prevotellaceae bacterium]
MRRLAAHYIFPISAPPLRNGLLTLGDDGEVLQLESGSDRLDEREGVEFYSGIIVPGFVNAHCHLELSYLKGLVPQGTGLAGFIRQLSQLRNVVGEADAQRAMALADAQMYAGGTVAVGDVSNGRESFAVKARSRIVYHTFVERYGLRREDVPAGIASAKALLREAELLGLSASATPHAPYSTCDAMYDALSRMDAGFAPLWSVHNQECEDENNLFINGGGELQRMFAGMGLPLPQPTGSTSIGHTMRHVSAAQRLALVHNVCTSSEDYDLATAQCSRITWVMCCASNHHIGRALPPIDMLRSKGASLALGTDSLASNHSLLMVDELKFLSSRFPHIPLHEMLSWATLGGAKAVGKDEVFGSFEIGKRPGAVLLSCLNLDEQKITSDTKAFLLTKK